MRVAVLLVHTAALGHDLRDLGATHGGSFLVRSSYGLVVTASEVLGGVTLLQPLGELVLGQESNCWPKMSVTEEMDRYLGTGLFAYLSLGFWR